MEFNEKLQALRKKKDLTQEELATMLYVSRTAVSKWESGRGYPNIDSLKRIAEVFSVSIDELISGNELLSIAEEENKEKKHQFNCISLGLLDILASLLLFLPFFAQRIEGSISEVSLLSLLSVSPYLKILYVVSVASIAVFGLFILCLQSLRSSKWTKWKGIISFILSALSILLFIIGLQPYAAIFLFSLFLIKLYIYINF